jgi:hypothetical protein
MPRKLVMQAWRERFGNDCPRVVGQDKPSNAVEEFAAGLNATGVASRNEVLEYFARPFAEEFLVSPVAMRIRLERLGLLDCVPIERSLLIQR